MIINITSCSCHLSLMAGEMLQLEQSDKIAARILWFGVYEEVGGTSCLLNNGGNTDEVLNRQEVFG